MRDFCRNRRDRRKLLNQFIDPQVELRKQQFQETKNKFIVKHRIDTGNHRPVQSKMYKYNINVQMKVEEKIRDFIDQGICRFISSSWASQNQ